MAGRPVVEPVTRPRRQVCHREQLHPSCWANVANRQDPVRHAHRTLQIRHQQNRVTDENQPLNQARSLVAFETNRRKYHGWTIRQQQKVEIQFAGAEIRFSVIPPSGPPLLFGPTGNGVKRCSGSRASVLFSSSSDGDQTHAGRRT